MLRIVKTCFVFYLLLGTSYFYTQNLVNNPSFETYTSCPTASDQLKNATGWTAYRDSPDYFNSCNFSSLSVPSNAVGYQNGFGNGYAGFVAYTNLGFYREILGSQMTQTLAIGATYYVSLKISLAEFDANTQQYIPCNKVGMKFSTVPFSTITPAPINNFGHIYTNSIITDTMNWVTIGGSFVADSNYKYLMIGNFFDDTNTDTIYRANGTYSYFFVDDICVSTSSITCPIPTKITNQNKTSDHSTVFPNPANNSINISSTSLKSSNLILSDLSGSEIYSKDFKKELVIHISDLPNGMYFIQIKNENSIFTKKIIINHN